MSYVINVAIVSCSNALKSAVFGLEEMFLLANRMTNDLGNDVVFQPKIISQTELASSRFHVIILPPSVNVPSEEQQTAIGSSLRQQYQSGAVITAACAGVFLLAASGLAGNREVTTHWALAEIFKRQFPTTKLNTNKIVINHQDVMTAGGMMSWVDLGFEIIAKYTSSQVVRQLGKTLVVDTAPRKQSFYQQFVPDKSHGDEAILNIQQYINLRYHEPLEVRALAQYANMTERTMQRRFLKATGYSPNQYLQRLRIQKVCELLESTQSAFESIVYQVGYTDISACRKVFIKVMGLTPREFRQRFSK
ncbi:GlxA family transcriptional regulator [Vibrio olivae]|uniref:GlxA family transcriptional regulator n=1 Tax=Vibrio olivae TaxID=1243002 RepID=A0ABV5HKF4_9VIBR